MYVSIYICLENTFSSKTGEDVVLTRKVLLLTLNLYNKIISSLNMNISKVFQLLLFYYCYYATILAYAIDCSKQ